MMLSEPLPSKHYPVSVGVQSPHPSPAAWLCLCRPQLFSALTHPLLLFDYPLLSFLNSLLLNWAALLSVEYSCARQNWHYLCHKGFAPTRLKQYNGILLYCGFKIWR